MRRAAGALAVLTLATALLAGCTAAPEPTEPAPPEATAAPASTPAVAVLEVPLPRAAADCGTLLPAEALAGLGGEWALARDGGGAPQTALQAARRQAGASDCAWTGADGASLAFLLIPDAQHEESLYTIRHLFEDGIRFDPVGPDSLLICDATGCDFSLLVAGEHWLAGRVVAGDPEALSAAVVPVLEGLRERASAAVEAPNPVWSNPPAVHPGWGRTCGDAGLVEGMRRLAGRPALAEGAIRFPEHDLVVVERVDPGYCRLLDGDGDGRAEVLLALVPGGAWAVHELLGEPGVFEAVDVDGLGRVVVGGDPARFTALAALQGSLVQVGMPAADRAAFLEVLPDVVALIARTPYSAPVED